MACLAALILFVVGLFFASVSSLSLVTSDERFKLKILPDNSYQVYVDNIAWLASAPTVFTCDNKQFSTADKSLDLIETRKLKGLNAIGPWSSLELHYMAGRCHCVASFKAYENEPALVFGQHYPSGIANSASGTSDEILSRFPSFKIDSSRGLGYLAYNYLFAGNMRRKFGSWSNSSLQMESGRNGGPLVLTDARLNTLWISSFSSFMTASPYHDAAAASYSWGIMGSVKVIPARFKSETIIFYGIGARQTVLGWGTAMRRYYARGSEADALRDADITNSHLSYWTDNGAYYVNYYTPDWLINNTTFEKAMIGVRAYAEQEAIPYRSVQYSVWYQTHGVHTNRPGTTLWEANKHMIPDGMAFMRDVTQWPSTVHNRFWSSYTPYARQNGGRYKFIIDNKNVAVPVDLDFWIDIFRQSRVWGFKNYMQDWLNVAFDEPKATRETVDVARTWLTQMGEGARLNGMTIQYCMSQPRHVLQALEIPTVTQIRASDDYQPSNDYSYEQWDVGFSSLFSWAVGLQPFKDTFWTTSHQPGNFYRSHDPFVELQAAVASLTGGPVGPGDAIGLTNRSLLMRCCNEDGLILKPDRPALPVDSMLLQRSFGMHSGASGQVWSTFSQIGAHTFGIIFAANISMLYSLTATEAFGTNEKNVKVYRFGGDEKLNELQDFSDDAPLVLSPECSRKNFCLFYTSPVLLLRSRPLVILGEHGKWIPMSSRRFRSIELDSDDIVLALAGAAGETVAVSYVWRSQLRTVKCTLGASLRAKISLATRTCF